MISGFGFVISGSEDSSISSIYSIGFKSSSSSSYCWTSSESFEELGMKGSIGGL